MRFIFSNNKFNLDYCTMFNPEIINIPTEVLPRRIFISSGSSIQINVRYKYIKRGYNVIDYLS
jgi:hypothetical protein